MYLKVLMLTLINVIITQNVIEIPLAENNSTWCKWNIGFYITVSGQGMFKPV